MPDPKIDTSLNTSLRERIDAADKERANVAFALSEDDVLAAMDPHGATMKLGAIIAGLKAQTGHSEYALNNNVQGKLRRMRKAGRVELTKGPGSGWRRTGKTP